MCGKALKRPWQRPISACSAPRVRCPRATLAHGVDTPEPVRRVLVVEDEPHIRDLVALHLRLDGWTIDTCGHGDEALRLIQSKPFDLIVLDLMLPGLDGLTILKALRREKVNGDVPVLLLTARREEADKVLGLMSGADDYLTKPFGVRELVARANALTRRPRASATAVAGTAVAGAPANAAASADANAEPERERERANTHQQAQTGDVDHAGPPVRLRNLTIDPARRRVTVDGKSIDVTSLEFDLMYLLASSPGIVFSRRALISRVWKDDTFVTERSVDTLVKRLRRKIEVDPADPQLILTVWGTGYKAADV
jgi:DNA-binding response OmpR family regulator